MDQNYLETRAHILEVVRQSGPFPENVEISVRDGAGSAIVAVMSWVLNNDAARPNKRSTEISLVIVGPATDLFREAEEDQLQKLDETLRAVVRRRMRDYREDYNFPLGKTSPTFKIHISPVDLG